MAFHFDIHQAAAVQTEIKTFDGFKLLSFILLDHDGKELGKICLYQGKGSIPEILPITEIDCRTPKKEETQTP